MRSGGARRRGVPSRRGGGRESGIRMREGAEMTGRGAEGEGHAPTLAWPRRRPRRRRTLPGRRANTLWSDREEGRVRFPSARPRRRAPRSWSSRASSRRLERGEHAPRVDRSAGGGRAPMRGRQAPPQSRDAHHRSHRVPRRAAWPVGAVLCEAATHEARPHRAVCVHRSDRGNSIRVGLILRPVSTNPDLPHISQAHHL